ncbi:hypothetical protein QFZ01_004796 [Enterobacter kobei]|uniref:hypothetical protein n=1 Tax=Enterobacter kobei TaxID=208224 RepID=UPI002938B86D|nr:hypothetical protein [Enterobacter kobei]
MAGELPETKRSEAQVIATIGTILVWALIVVAAAAGLFFAFIGFIFFISWPK